MVVGEPQRAFYGNQFGNTFPLFEHYGVPLWVPEIGGPIDPANEAHDMIMSTFGSISKGERSRIKTRVRATMAAMAQTSNRHMGGRPPYGYRLADAGPHPNPSKAADGKRLHVLEIDPYAAEVVRRIFAEFLGGKGIFAIAEGLTADGILSPSAYDPARNRHRSGVAWSKSAIRVILTNPRYTGRQVWNKQRKREVLIDVHDVALGHETRQVWNTKDTWVWSEDIVNPQIIDDETFTAVQQLLAARGHGPTSHKPHRHRHPTYCAASCSAGSAIAACKASRTTERPTTDADSPTSTRRRTGSPIPATSTCARTRSCPPWTGGWASTSPHTAARTLSPPSSPPKAETVRTPPLCWRVRRSPNATANSPATGPPWKPSTTAPIQPSSPAGSKKPNSSATVPKRNYDRPHGRPP